MKKYFLIARSNLRRTKGQTVATAVLVFITALMLNLWLMLSMDYKSNFNRYHDKLNAGHVTLAVGSSDNKLKNFISKTLDNDSRTTQYCISDAFANNASFGYNGGEISTSFVFLNKQEAINRTVEKIEIVEDSSYKSGIYLPVLYSTDKNIQPGKKISLKIGNITADYTICGFINSVMAGSHNCIMCTALLTDDKYKELEEKEWTRKALFTSVRIKDKTESDDFEASLKNSITSEYPGIDTASNSYILVSSSRYISQMICSGIICVMAFMTAFIAFVVISSNVINYIQKNMKNIGVLKAGGYKSSQIICTLLIQFLYVTLLTSAAGAGFSYCLFPYINTMMASQTGIPYKIKFLPLPFLLAIAFIAGTVFAAVWFSSHRIKKIEPVVAIRQGIQTHNFKRNHIPLENTHMPLNTALALKTTFSGIKQNIIVCTTMLVLSLVIVFSGLMIANVIVDMEPFINMVAGETSDSSISIPADSSERFLQIIEKDKRVEKIYFYYTVETRHSGNAVLMATLSDDFSKLNNQDICIEGRFPKYDNETAVAAKYAKEKNLKIGSEIILEADGKEEKYIISGFTQISNNLGKDCMLTCDGYKRMAGLVNECYSVNLEDGTDIDKFNKEIADKIGNGVQSVNIKAVIDSTATVYVSLMAIIVAGIIILSLIIVIFVMYLLVRTMLNNKKRDYGIMKAAGFTTGQLIFQTAASFMPAVIISTAAGIILSSFIINPLVAFFLNGIGIVKCTFKVPVAFNIAAGTGLVIFTFLAVCVMSFKIRKNAPVELMAGE
ncbi:MAG: ABC transporter permease [Lachnospiraceae bacterium]|nr:ABC transporter permease [Lachnospiraceae bacterium]